MRRALLLVPLLAGCAGLSDLARSAFREPTLAFRSADVQALDLEGATIGLSFDLDNPNGFGLDLARAGWGVDVEGTRIATGDMPGGLAIPARGKAPITLPVRIRFADVPGIVSLLTGGRDEIGYRVAGSVGVRTPFGVVDLPVSHQDRVKLPGLPRFAIDGVSVRSASLTDVAVDVKVRVQNPNGFAIPAGRLAYALSVAGSEVARGDGAPLGAVAGRASGVLSVPVRVNLVRAGSAAAALVRGGPVRVGLAGTAEVGGIPLPLDLEATVPARR